MNAQSSFLLASRMEAVDQEIVIINDTVQSWNSMRHESVTSEYYTSTTLWVALTLMGVATCVFVFFIGAVDRSTGIGF